MIYLWLDDVRKAPPGWIHCKTIQEAKALLQSGQVHEASLDHDLGICDKCLEGYTYEEWINARRTNSIPDCEHYGTGYQLVCWMEETGNWPKHKPRVHSANPVGRARMEQAINHSFGKKR